MPEENVSMLALLAVRTGQARIPAVTVLFVELQQPLQCGAVGKFGERLGDPHLHICRELSQRIGRLLRHLPAVPRRTKVRQQMLPDHLDPGQLGAVGVAGRCHHVPHPALRELKTVLLQLIQ